MMFMYQYTEFIVACCVLLAAGVDTYKKNFRCVVASCHHIASGVDTVSGMLKPVLYVYISQRAMDYF